jgi:hypothetical protein
VEAGMTRSEVVQAINGIIEDAVRRSNGHPTLYFRDVEKIFGVIGKLSPEVKDKPKVPPYNQKKVRRVGTLVERSQFTQEQRDAAVAALRAVGLL